MLKVFLGIAGTVAIFSLVFPVAAHQGNKNLTRDNLSSSTPEFNNQLPSKTLISYQQNYLSLSRYELREPLYLRIKSKKNAKLLGWIYLNGSAFKKLEDKPIEIDLSSVLQPGINEIDISGFFRPVQGVVTVELKGAVSRISHSTGGDGVLQQKIRINVN